MGGTATPNPNNDDGSDLQTIRLALQNDVTLIDTAQNYAAGKCEELVGKAVKKYPRSSYQILTKQQKSQLTYEQVIDGCKASLKRLRLDCIDYFVCHAPNPDVDMRDFFKASNQLHREGLIKNVGVSNFGPKMLQLAIDNSDLPISLNQVSFSLGDYDIISSGTYDFCVQNNIPIQAYQTIAGINANRHLLSLLKPLTHKYKTTPQQIALSYLNSYKDIHFTIRASSKEHWQQIKQALELKLSLADIDNLHQYHQRQKGSNGHFLTLESKANW